MRVLMISKALVVGIYQRKLEEIARLNVDLMAVVPPSWRDERGESMLERIYTDGYELKVLPLVNNGDFHLHYYRGLDAVMRQFQPDIVHIDEEPYNLATWQTLFFAKRCRAKTVLFSWQNILRRYPPPFGWGEAWTLRSLDYLIAGTDSAADVWRAKGYRGKLAVIPQFGTDSALFQPAQADVPERPFTIGYFGRLVEEKGVHLLLDAAARLPGDWQLLILGGGPMQTALAERASHLGIAQRVTFLPQVVSMQMPSLYYQIDVLALPSLTRSNWKEQFGRVLVEAMMSGVPVVGSDSAAIPGVVGEGGLIVPEGNAAALADALGKLQQDAELRRALGQKGRTRALAQFTQEQVATATVRVYQEVMSE
ncbi:MAG: glycosyltransferase family 4 protein [Anaerolineae bacterium]|nr:glycosyltransferase family 4 protein [Anaerolineae bacterium]